tara:strand:- start:4892 stop:5320 length:429 start_codon:yes stop_codon:yes gene_type:complete
MSEFSVRLKDLIVDNYGNANKFCVANNYDYSLIRSYIRGDSEPKLSNCLSLAKVLNVSPSWLAYGVEDVTDEKENEIIDLVNLIHMKVDEWLDSRDKEMDLDKKSILVKLIYKKLQLKELESLSTEEVNKSIDDIIEILDAA